MMPTLCHSCGNRLGPDGSCPLCLLRLGIGHPHNHGEVHPLLDSAPEKEAWKGHFPQLEIVRRIGHGGMGAVYLAKQTALDRDVALKIIHKDISGDPTFLERFDREAKTLAKLSHPHIVTVYDYGHTVDQMAYLVMEFVDGINLRQAIDSRSFTPREALDLVATICSALDAAHAKGIIHRDIKPENILLGEDGKVKIADFGIAKMVNLPFHETGLTATRQVIGSPNYMAPEQIESPHEVDHRIDIYAVGIVLYELLTGQLPLGRYETPTGLGVIIDPRIDAVVLKSLQRKPSQRYQSAAELLADIDKIRSSYSPAPILEPVVNKRSVSVPFEYQSENGVKWAMGLISAKADTLQIEFKFRDPLFGLIKSQTHLVEIPVEKIVKLSAKHGVMSTKLSITADTIRTLGNLPDAATGCVRLTTKRADRELVDNIVRILGFEEAKASSDLLSKIQQMEHQHLVLAILFLFCGILNGGLIAILQVLFKNTLSGVALETAAVTVSVLIGPVAVLQIITGILNLTTRVPALCKATSIVSMIPITPGWIVSFPIGFWGWTILGDSNRRTNIPLKSPSKSQSWGATTVMLLRESRTAQVVSLLNGIGILLFAAGLFLYYGGFYSTSIEYRIVDSNWDRVLLHYRLHARLNRLSNIAIEIPNRESQSDSLESKANLREQSNRIRVSAWRFQRTEILSSLAITNQVQLACLLGKDSTKIDEAEGTSFLPTATGLDLASLSSRSTGLGIQAATVGTTIDLSNDLVVEIRGKGSRGTTTALEESRRSLTLELSSAGRECLSKSELERSEVVGLGLIVNGVLEGIALRDGISNQELHFQLAPKSKWSLASFIAALRGPALPSELELLE